MGWYCKKCGYAGMDELPKEDKLKDGSHNCAKMKREERKEFARVTKEEDKYKTLTKIFGKCRAYCTCSNECVKNRFHFGEHYCPVIYSEGCKWS